MAAADPTWRVTVPVVADTFFTSAVSVLDRQAPYGLFLSTHRVGDAVSPTFSMAPRDGAWRTTAAVADAVSPPTAVALRVMVRFPAVTGPDPTGMDPVQLVGPPVRVMVPVPPLLRGYVPVTDDAAVDAVTATLMAAASV